MKELRDDTLNWRMDFEKCTQLLFIACKRDFDKPDQKNKIEKFLLV
jgi:hypothetical protein